MIMMMNLMDFLRKFLLLFIKIKQNNNGYHFANSLLQPFAVIGAYYLLRFIGSAYMRIFINLPF